jgi:HlyD family secretion protein
MRSLEIEVDVNEAFIARVSPNQSVAAVLDAYPDTRFPGRVIATIPTANRDRATVRVRISLETRDARILPEMAVKVTFLEQR